MGEIVVWKEGGRWRFDGDAGYETRRASVERLITECDRADPLPDRPRHLAVTIQLGDQPTQPISKPINEKSLVVGFCTVAGSGLTAAPDFVFDHWAQVGISDYDETCEQVALAGKLDTKPEGRRKAGWIGNFDTNPRRHLLGRIASRFPALLNATDTGPWKQETPKKDILKSADSKGDLKGDLKMVTSRGGFVGLAELVSSYDYLVDVEGVGYSGRLKILLHSAKPVLLQERPWREFYFDQLKPFVHYVPVRRDLQDLVWRIDWLNKHPEEAKKIGNNAAQFAKNHLTRPAALRTWRALLAPPTQTTPPQPTPTVL